jgi:hypothetical protein
MQSRCSVRLVGTLVFFVNDDEANLVTQCPKRNARTDHEMWARLKEAVMCVESFTGAQA